jgi:hypothetical protein
MELLTARLASLQPATPAQLNPPLSSLPEITETQLCSLLPDEIIEKLFSGKGESQSTHKWEWVNNQESFFACDVDRGTQRAEVVIREEYDTYRPEEVFEIHGRKAVIELERGAVFLPDDQLLEISFSGLDDKQTAKPLIQAALTNAVTQLENMGALAPRSSTMKILRWLQEHLSCHARV